MNYRKLFAMLLRCNRIYDYVINNKNKYMIDDLYCEIKNISIKIYRKQKSPKEKQNIIEDKLLQYFQNAKNNQINSDIILTITSFIHYGGLN